MDVDQLRNCPLKPACESCGSTHFPAVTTLETSVGTLCATLCGLCCQQRTVPYGLRSVVATGRVTRHNDHRLTLLETGGS